jgi:hypothetical protein
MGQTPAQDLVRAFDRDGTHSLINEEAHVSSDSVRDVRFVVTPNIPLANF